MVPAAAVREDVAAAHDELETVTFTAFIAPHMHAGFLAHDVEITRAGLRTPSAIGLVEMGVPGSDNALHVGYHSKQRAMLFFLPDTSENADFRRTPLVDSSLL